MDATGRRSSWDRSLAYARLGSSIRAILVAPREGFRSAMAAVDRRIRLGRRPAEGVGPYVLAAVGGAALMLLWLKVGGLLDLRSVDAADFRWGYLVASLFAGALLGLMGQFLWGGLGRAVIARFTDGAKAHDLRLVWGAAALPQTVAFMVLLPLDLLIVGRHSFTTERLSDPVATAWAALSVALAVSLAVWSAWIFLRGVEVAAGTNLARAAVGIAVALVCLMVALALFGVALVGLAGALR